MIQIRQIIQFCEVIQNAIYTRRSLRTFFGLNGLAKRTSYKSYPDSQTAGFLIICQKNHGKIGFPARKMLNNSNSST